MSRDGGHSDGFLEHTHVGGGGYPFLALAEEGSESGHVGAGTHQAPGGSQPDGLTASGRELLRCLVVEFAGEQSFRESLRFGLGTGGVHIVYKLLNLGYSQVQRKLNVKGRSQIRNIDNGTSFLNTDHGEWSGSPFVRGRHVQVNIVADEGQSQSAIFVGQQEGRVEEDGEVVGESERGGDRGVEGEREGLEVGESEVPGRGVLAQALLQKPDHSVRHIHRSEGLGSIAEVSQDLVEVGEFDRLVNLWELDSQDFE